ncbi:MAG: FMN-binding protein [Coriobacteriia bacterium]|nr:FMN-binding protein [Coriobacteriia bacterium]
MNRSLQLIIAVLVTCVVAATGLALTYGLTAPRIEEQDRLAEERSLTAVLPDADEFELVEDAEILDAATEAALPAELKSVYRAIKGGEPVGWGIKLASRGYGGPMQLVIGLDTSGSVSGVSILSMNETPGLGTKVQTEKWFIEQFAELPAGFSDGDVRGLDVISGSTRSSNGVRNGVAAAGRAYLEALSDYEGGSE